MKDAVSEKAVEDILYEAIDSSLKDFQMQLLNKLQGHHSYVGTARVTLSKVLARAITHTALVASLGGIIQSEEES